jgi:hypothetical protein
VPSRRPSRVSELPVDAQAEADQRRAQAQAFPQGRIDIYLTRLRHTEDDQLTRLHERAALAARSVANIECDWFQDSVERSWRGDDPVDPDSRLIRQAWFRAGGEP